MAPIFSGPRNPTTSNVLGESIWEIFLLGVLMVIVAEVYVANRRLAESRTFLAALRLRRPI